METILPSLFNFGADSESVSGSLQTRWNRSNPTLIDLTMRKPVATAIEKWRRLPLPQLRLPKMVSKHWKPFAKSFWSRTSDTTSNDKNDPKSVQLSPSSPGCSANFVLDSNSDQRARDEPEITRTFGMEGISTIDRIRADCARGKSLTQPDFTLILPKWAFLDEKLEHLVELGDNLKISPKLMVKYQALVGRHFYSANEVKNPILVAQKVIVVKESDVRTGVSVSILDYDCFHEVVEVGVMQCCSAIVSGGNGKIVHISKAILKYQNKSLFEHLRSGDELSVTLVANWPDSENEWLVIGVQHSTMIYGNFTNDKATDCVGILTKIVSKWRGNKRPKRVRFRLLCVGLGAGTIDVGPSAFPELIPIEIGDRFWFDAVKNTTNTDRNPRWTCVGSLRKENSAIIKSCLVSRSPKRYSREKLLQLRSITPLTDLSPINMVASTPISPSSAQSPSCISPMKTIAKSRKTLADDGDLTTSSSNIKIAPPIAINSTTWPCPSNRIIIGKGFVDKTIMDNLSDANLSYGNRVPISKHWSPNTGFPVPLSHSLVMETVKLGQQLLSPSDSKNQMKGAASNHDHQATDPSGCGIVKNRTALKQYGVGRLIRARDASRNLSRQFSKGSVASTGTKSSTKLSLGLAQRMTAERSRNLEMANDSSVSPVPLDTAQLGGEIGSPMEYSETDFVLPEFWPRECSENVYQGDQKIHFDNSRDCEELLEQNNCTGSPLEYLETDFVLPGIWPSRCSENVFQGNQQIQFSNSRDCKELLEQNNLNENTSDPSCGYCRLTPTNFVLSVPSSVLMVDVSTQFSPRHSSLVDSGSQTDAGGTSGENRTLEILKSIISDEDLLQLIRQKCFRDSCNHENDQSGTRGGATCENWDGLVGQLMEIEPIMDIILAKYPKTKLTKKVPDILETISKSSKIGNCDGNIDT